MSHVLQAWTRASGQPPEAHLPRANSQQGSAARGRLTPEAADPPCRPPPPPEDAGSDAGEERGPGAGLEDRPARLVAIKCLWKRPLLG